MSEYLSDTIAPYTFIEAEQGSIPSFSHYVCENLATFGLHGVRISSFRDVNKIENKMSKGCLYLKKNKKIESCLYKCLRS